MSEGASAPIGVLAGSGIDSMEGFSITREVRIDTPYGAPSAPVVLGRIDGHPLAFLARHGTQHTILPSEINYRANIYALKTLGVERIVSASAVGSMRESIRPRDVVLVDQFIDRTAHRPATFFGDGVAAHVSFADPVCGQVREALLSAARAHGARAHDGGTYVCIEGPAFSTRAESRLFRSWNVDVIGMTNLQEAKLSREAEICYSTMALVTDYDCWHDEVEAVTVESLLEHLRANQQLAVELIHRVLLDLAPRPRNCGCSTALAGAIMTPRDAISDQARARLRPIIGKYLDDRS